MPSSGRGVRVPDGPAPVTAPAPRQALDAAQRWTDVALVLAALPVWLPVLGAALAVTRLSNRGPFLFHQRRMGRDGRPFTIHKIRTMRSGIAPPSGALFAGWTYAGDPRVTRSGGFLRRYRLDELPQLWNVLCGDMNLVGPRPEPWEIAQRLGGELPGYHQRHTVRPGLTGLCQISPAYRDFGTLEKSGRKLAYDLEYVQTRSARLNAWILYRTVAVVCQGEGMA